jgi:hypothetical protein
MLVLALQFSRCDDRRMRSMVVLDAEAPESSTPSKRKRRLQSPAIVDTGGRNLATVTSPDDDLPVHQQVSRRRVIMR